MMLKFQMHRHACNLAQACGPLRNSAMDRGRNPDTCGLNLGDTDHSAAFDAGADGVVSIRAR